MDIGFRRLHRITLVMYRRCRACEIVNFIYLDIERKSYVVADQFEIGTIQQMGNVGLRTGVVIVDTYDFVAAFDQAFA